MPLIYYLSSMKSVLGPPAAGLRLLRGCRHSCASRTIRSGFSDCCGVPSLVLASGKLDCLPLCHHFCAHQKNGKVLNFIFFCKFWFWRKNDILRPLRASKNGKVQNFSGLAALPPLLRASTKLQNFTTLQKFVNFLHRIFQFVQKSSSLKFYTEFNSVTKFIQKWIFLRPTGLRPEPLFYKKGARRVARCKLCRHDGLRPDFKLRNLYFTQTASYSNTWISPQISRQIRFWRYFQQKIILKLN